MWDSNPRCAKRAHSISNAAPSTTRTTFLYFLTPPPNTNHTSNLLHYQLCYSHRKVQRGTCTPSQSRALVALIHMSLTVYLSVARLHITKRVTGFEPVRKVWKTSMLPLHHTRSNSLFPKIETIGSHLDARVVICEIRCSLEERGIHILHILNHVKEVFDQRV